MCCVRSSVKTDCTTASGILGGDTSTSDCEVYLAVKAYETRNPTIGASSAGIRITFLQWRKLPPSEPAAASIFNSSVSEVAQFSDPITILLRRQIVNRRENLRHWSH
jgi:hypothetical protein